MYNNINSARLLLGYARQTFVGLYAPDFLIWLLVHERYGNDSLGVRVASVHFLLSRKASHDLFLIF